MVKGVDQMGSPVSGPYPEGMYGIYSELKVTFVAQPDRESSGLAKRLESHLVQTREGLSSQDFLKKIQALLQNAGMKRVMSINRNDVMIFTYDDKEGEGAWSEPFAVASKAAASPDGDDEWWILVTGSNLDFKFRLDVTFKQKHSVASPSMRFVIRALPAEWAPSQEKASTPGRQDFGKYWKTERR